MVSILKFSIEVCFHNRKLSHARWEPLSIPLEMLVAKYAGSHVWSEPCTPFGSEHNHARLEMFSMNGGIQLDAVLTVTKSQGVMQAKTFWFTDFAKECTITFSNGDVIGLDCCGKPRYTYGTMDELFHTARRVKIIRLPDLKLTILKHEPYLHFKVFRRGDFTQLEMFLRWTLDYLPKGVYTTSLLLEKGN